MISPSFDNVDGNDGNEEKEVIICSRQVFWSVQFEVFSNVAPMV